MGQQAEGPAGVAHVGQLHIIPEQLQALVGLQIVHHGPFAEPIQGQHAQADGPEIKA
jgi:hypothetical protein